jgi:hypothetical protein
VRTASACRVVRELLGRQAPLPGRRRRSELSRHATVAATRQCSMAPGTSSIQRLALMNGYNVSSQILLVCRWMAMQVHAVPAAWRRRPPCSCPRHSPHGQPPRALLLLAAPCSQEVVADLGLGADAAAVPAG